MENIAQSKICRRFDSDYHPPLLTEKVGIALETLQLVPLNALRTTPENGTCGWYIWGGEQFSEAADFFSPLCVEHLPQRCPDIVAYLALVPGFRVLLAPNYEDVWFDDRLNS